MLNKSDSWCVTFVFKEPVKRKQGFASRMKHFGQLDNIFCFYVFIHIFPYLNPPLLNFQHKPAWFSILDHIVSWKEHWYLLIISLWSFLWSWLVNSHPFFFHLTSYPASIFRLYSVIYHSSTKPWNYELNKQKSVLFSFLKKQVAKYVKSMWIIIFCSLKKYDNSCRKTS